MSKQNAQNVKIGINAVTNQGDYYGTVELTIDKLPDFIEYIMQGQKPENIEEILYPKNSYDIYLGLFWNTMDEVWVDIDGNNEEVKQKVKDILARIKNVVLP